RTIAGAFAISLSKEENDLVSRRPTTNGEAYILYLRGRELLHQGTFSAVKAASELFQQAIAKDPDLGEAYAGAAHSYFHIFEARWADDAQALSQAGEFARKATALRPNLAEARTVLGGVLQASKKYQQALDELDQALTSMPSNAEAQRIMGLVYSIGGEEGKALDHLRSAYQLDPVSPDVLTSIALANQRFGKPKEAMGYFNQALPFISDTTTFLAEIAGNALVSSYQYDRAISIYEKRVALNQKSFIDQYKLARAYQLAAKPATVWSGAFEKTIDKTQQELEDNPDNVIAVAYQGLAYSRYGRFPDGEASGKKALEMAPKSLTIRYRLADLYSIQKKKAQAITALKDALNSRYILAEIVDLDLFNISDEPEFQQAIVEEIR
ncbi:MAG: tetratricopeptide repeat protein, partial [Terriglobia bacterium]